jgi:hypothetical protein
MTLTENEINVQRAAAFILGAFLATSTGGGSIGDVFGGIDLPATLRTAAAISAKQSIDSPMSIWKMLAAAEVVAAGLASKSGAVPLKFS